MLREFDARLQKGSDKGARTYVVTRKAIGKEAGDTVHVRLEERIG